MPKSKFIKCSCCQNSFKRLFETQARECAASVIEAKTEKNLVCYYGSNFDMNVYKIHKTSELNKLTPAEVLCDDCIARFVEKGDLVFSHQTSFF